MGHKKLVRFAEIETFPNVLQYPEGIAGKWKEFFKNDNPITLELACGKGEYTLGLARMYPQRNFLGIDLKGNRIWAGARKALAEGLGNAAFLRILIDGIEKFFAPGEVDEIWITFPDPQLRTGKAKKRLTHPRFLRRYQQLLKPGGRIHLKTDSPNLYGFTMKVCEMYGCTVLEHSDNVYAQPEIKDELKIKTYYESLDIAGAARVHYVCFTLPQTIPGTELDARLQEELKENEQPAG
ncbi:tRNA (guanosine(46)-N7)-methyltransferase TrmB [Flaviaesturariibacter flavus]|uniref:tRNA (guanine-N(7)-)-methyltransferase n=1 Tax=Flaviaesturariibacter flavus TaxID=2502780 RepID=A0A4R1BIB6_9BACT|nr:tRNA (guanosine(46)-N7)-methyltransferase TrmB [Flaviaesturariibacter flavus]TCJ17026.1 tRNA (guanosine(46)-N7)-methyltransferase TrmB [Flaviaesturariibacter flavus]